MGRWFPQERARAPAFPHPTITNTLGPDSPKKAADFTPEQIRRAIRRGRRRKP